MWDHHHHHVAPPARISLTLSRHFSLSFIASGRYSGLHPVSSHSCCMYVRAGRPTLAHPYVGVHRSTSLMSSSLLLQQCPACLVRRTCIVFVGASVRTVGVSWGEIIVFKGFCLDVLFNTLFTLIDNSFCRALNPPIFIFCKWIRHPVTSLYGVSARLQTKFFFTVLLKQFWNILKSNFFKFFFK